MYFVHCTSSLVIRVRFSKNVFSLLNTTDHPHNQKNLKRMQINKTSTRFEKKHSETLDACLLPLDNPLLELIDRLVGGWPQLVLAEVVRLKHVQIRLRMAFALRVARNRLNRPSVGNSSVGDGQIVDTIVVQLVAVTLKYLPSNY